METDRFAGPISSFFPGAAPLGRSLALFLGLFFLSSTLKAALVEVHNTVAGPTPGVLAYNLGNFHPDSNTTDWWRYSRASGARMFMNASRFNISLRGEDQVTTQQAFLDRRAALRADPLNTSYIAWPAFEDRFTEVIPGSNRIVPEYAYEQIRRHGGKAFAQLSLSESLFPVVDDNDWTAKWETWRTYYSLVFHLARHFDVQRYSSHNEPNHHVSFIEPEAWLRKLKLASDATQSAIEDVNRIYGKQLTPIMAAPVTAGWRTGFENYGSLVAQNQHADFLNQTRVSNTLFHLYAYQQYNAPPANFGSGFLTLRENVNNKLPPTSPPLRFAVTEYNVHTGARYDEMTETANTLSKATRFGAINTRLMRNGVDELYAFKFGMTPAPSTRNFPVAKNGTLYTDNANAPYNYGTMSLSAEVYRLFNKAFAPGRKRLDFDLSGSGASDLEVQVSHDPATGFYYVFSVNETSNAIPFQLDVSSLNIPEGNHLIVEDVSLWRRGVIRSMHQVENGTVDPGSQPGNTVWLISIPGRAQTPVTANSNLIEIPVSKDVMVKDGSFDSTNFENSADAWARNHPTNTSERSAVFLQYDLPSGWDPAELQMAILEVRVKPVQGGSETIHAHLYGIDNHAWNELSLTWQNAPNLKKAAPAGDRIRHGVVDDAGFSAHILGQLTASGSSYTTRRVDVTDYLIRQTGNKASFLIVQDPRWNIDIHVDTMPNDWSELVEGDTQPDGLRVRTKEGAGGDASSQLILIQSDR